MDEPIYVVLIERDGKRHVKKTEWIIVEDVEIITFQGKMFTRDESFDAEFNHKHLGISEDEFDDVDYISFAQSSNDELIKFEDLKVVE